MSDGGQTVPRITKAEHIGPADTGDNIEAKRVAVYDWDGTNWNRHSSALATRIFPDGTTTYIAKAPVGTTAATSSWQVKKIAVSGSNTYITWAGGSASFTNPATDLSTVAALSYS